MSKDTKITPIINLSAKMNTRSNNEVLDSDANQTGIELTYIQNADLFFTKSTTSREGIKDIAGGIVNATAPVVPLFDYHTPSGTQGEAQVYLQDQYSDREGIIVVANSGMTIFSGKRYLKGHEATLIADINYDLQLNVWINKVNATSYPASGVGGILNTRPSTGNIDDITLAGYNYDQTTANILQLVYPQTSFFSFPLVDSKPDAISRPTIFNLGPYSGTAGDYNSDIKEVDWELYAPFDLQSGSVYYIKMILNNTSGTSAREVKTMFNISTVTDFDGFTIEAKERVQGGVFNTLSPGNATPIKTWIDEIDNSYPTPSYALVDYPQTNLVRSIPLKGGIGASANYDTRIWTPATPVYNPQFKWPGLTVAPTDAYFASKSIVNGSTLSPAFGNIMTVPSGSHEIQGAYCYMNVISGNGWVPFTINKTSFPTVGYNVGYTCELSEVTGSAGIYTKGPVLASFSGNHVFNDPYTYVSPVNVSPAFDPTYDDATQTQLDKVYAVFDNPLTVNNTGNTQYLMTWQLFDFNTGSGLTDYLAKTQSFVFGPYYLWYTFASPIIMGLHKNLAPVVDMFVANDVSGTSTFRMSQEGNGDYNNLACGLISITSGNAITSIYDYRIGDSRTQEILFTQRDKVQSFLDADPTNTIATLYNGTVDASGTPTINDNYKWSWSTFQNLAFGHQYSKSSGLCWDQIYFNPSGNSMQFHGLRPVAEAFAYSGTTPPGVTPSAIASKSFDIILATAMNTGGFRSSEIINYSGISGSTINSVGLIGANTPYSGTWPFDIQFSGINDGKHQYNFDCNSLGTYVFTTQPSGSVYFLAELFDYSGNAISNPLPNVNTWGSVARSGISNTNVLIWDNSYTGIKSVQVPNIINYDQDYLINQVPTPKFKKTIVYKNTLYGIGDINNPSRLWYCEIQGPQIFGVDTNFYGFYDIDNDNGQELTGIEVFKDYLIIFKENSTYRASFTSNPGNPLEIFQVSNTKGCLGIFTTVASDYGIFGLNQFGPFLATYAGIENIGDEIYPYYQDLDRTELIFAVSIHDVARQQIYWSISSRNESPDNQTGIVYSYAEKAWGVRKNGMWNVAGRIGDIDNFSKYYIGDTYGQIKQINSGTYDQDVLFLDTNQVSLNKNIILTLETPWLNFGNSQTQKQLKFVKINCDNSNQKLRVDIYTDQNETTKKYSRFLNMNVPVINRVCSLAGVCRTVKLKITSVGLPAQVKINSIQLGYIDGGMASNIR